MKIKGSPPTESIQDWKGKGVSFTKKPSTSIVVLIINLISMSVLEK